jgi:hypothetical protein
MLLLLEQEDTIPNDAPAKIVLRRLDTDWYESTRNELIHFVLRRSIGGVLIDAARKYSLHLD